MLDDAEFDFQHGQDIALITKMFTPAMSPYPNLPLSEYRGSFPKGKSDRRVRMTTNPHLQLKLSGATPLLPLYAFIARRGTTLSVPLPYILELPISNLSRDTDYALAFR